MAPSRLSDRHAWQTFATALAVAFSVLLQARGWHEIGQMLAVAVGAVWLLHLTAARLNAKEALTEQLHAAVHEDLGAPAAGHGIRIRQRPVLLTRPGEVSCALTGTLVMLILLAVLLSSCTTPPCPPRAVSAAELAVEVDMLGRVIRIDSSVGDDFRVCDAAHGACFPLGSLREASIASGAGR